MMVVVVVALTSQVKVSEKSDAIIAIPKLPDMLGIAGAIVTIDAMGRQHAIARKIVDRNADHVRAPTGNHGSPRDDVEVFVAEQKPPTSRTPRSAAPRRSTAATAAPKPGPPPSSTLSPGCGVVPTGPT